MHIRLRLFASYAEVLGASELSLELPEGGTVADVLTELRRRPSAERLPPRPLVAVNLRYAAPGHALADGDEVALIPPVAGG